MITYAKIILFFRPVKGYALILKNQGGLFDSDGKK